MEHNVSKLYHFPISIFSIILGMAGFTIAIEKASAVLNFRAYTDVLPTILLHLTSALFVFLLAVYIMKWFRYREAVRTEFRHPVKLSFFPTISISLVLLSIAGHERYPIIAEYVWASGVMMHFAFTIRVISIWIHHTTFEIHHMNPSWFIPAVGNILVPILGIPLGQVEVSWFFFSIGLVFWIILLIIFFNRIIFHHPLPEKLFPTLFILIAPPAIGFVSLQKLMGEITPFGHILYYIALFMAILLFAQFNLFRKIQFFLSWWAYSFPLAAMTLSSLIMYQNTQVTGFRFLAVAFGWVLTAVIVILLFKTIQVALARKICVPD